MTASARQPAISYLLTRTLVTVVTSCCMLDRAVHPMLLAHLNRLHGCMHNLCLFLPNYFVCLLRIAENRGNCEKWCVICMCGG